MGVTALVTIVGVSARMHTDRLSIEVLGLAHAPGLLAALSVERVGRFIGGPDVTTLDALTRRIERLQQGPDRENERWINFAVLLGPTVVGRLEATVHDDIAEIAYVFGPRWWGHGYATEATSWLTTTLEAEGVQECWATVAPGNDASSNLLRRLSFVSVDVPPPVALLSYDVGDLAFLHRHVADL